MSWVLYPSIYVGSSWCFIAVFVAGIVGDPDSPSSFGDWIHYSAFQHTGVVLFLAMDFFLFFGVAVLTVVQASQVCWLFFTSFALPSNAGYFCAVLLYSCTIVNIVWSLTETTLIKLHELGKRKLLLLPFVFTIESFEALLDCWLDMLFWACSWFISARLLIDSRY